VEGLSKDAWIEMRDKRELSLTQDCMADTDDTRHSAMGESA
jgi:hypothetical protein